MQKQRLIRIVDSGPRTEPHPLGRVVDLQRTMAGKANFTAAESDESKRMRILTILVIEQLAVPVEVSRAELHQRNTHSKNILLGLKNLTDSPCFEVAAMPAVEHGRLRGALRQLLQPALHAHHVAALLQRSPCCTHNSSKPFFQKKTKQEQYHTEGRTTGADLVTSLSRSGGRVSSYSAFSTADGSQSRSLRSARSTACAPQQSTKRCHSTNGLTRAQRIPIVAWLYDYEQRE